MNKKIPQPLPAKTTKVPLASVELLEPYFPISQKRNLYASQTLALTATPIGVVIQPSDKPELLAPWGQVKYAWPINGETLLNLAR